MEHIRTAFLASRSRRKKIVLHVEEAHLDCFLAVAKPTQRSSCSAYKFRRSLYLTEQVNCIVRCAHPLLKNKLEKEMNK